MSKTKTQKIIAGVLMVTFSFSVVILPAQQALALNVYEPDPSFDPNQYNIEGTKNTNPNKKEEDNNYLGDTNSYKLNISTISEAIPAVIGCTGIVNKVQKSMAVMMGPKGKSGSGSSDGSLIGQGSTANNDDLISSMEGQNVPVNEINSSTIKDSATEIKKRQDEAKTREECLNGIAYSLAKAQLAKMTQITVNWINSGFDGNPLYIRDRESYFQSISDGQLLSIVGPLGSVQNQYIYPFGRSVARSLINSQKSDFESRARSTLQNSLVDGATTQDFANDFSKGGWDGWFSLTQNDQNNPLGFGIMTSQELADRTSKKLGAASSELLEGNGFLSQKVCVEYVNAEDQEKSSELFKNRVFNTNFDDYDKNGRECKRWETATPGSIIQNQAANSLTSSTRQLELADSLNESLSAVFQALVNQMVSKGLNSLSSFNPQNAPKTFGGLGSNSTLYDGLGNSISGLGLAGNNTNVLSVNKGRGWYNANGTFDITTDLGDIKKLDSNGKLYVYKKGIISIQKDYGESVKLSLATLPKIMPALGELDYCIPGPNANWEVAAKEVINKRIEYLQSLYFNGNGGVIAPYEDPLQPEADLVSSLSPSFSFVRGLIVNNKRKFEASLQRQEDERIAAKQATFEQQRSQAISQEAEQFRGYKERIDKLYGPESPMRSPGNPWYLPMAEAGLQATKYIREYNEDIKTATVDYKDLINQTNSNIYKLNVIKGKVDAIVRAARKRRAAEMEKKGIPMIDPSCYDLDPTQDVNGGGVTGQSTGKGTGGGLNYGPTAGSGTTTKGGVVGSTNGNTNIPGNNTTQEAISNFVVTMKEDRATCEATVYGTNKTSGQPTDISWGLKLSNDPALYSQKNPNFENTFSTYSQSGSATLTLTVKDLGGKTNSLSKSITIPKRTLTSKGTACPQ